MVRNTCKETTLWPDRFCRHHFECFVYLNSAPERSQLASRRDPNLDASGMPSSAAGPHVPSARQHVVGVTLAVCVAVIWVCSSELVQIIMGHDEEAEKSHPQAYFITYVSLSTFVLCLLGFLRPSWRAKLHNPPMAEPTDLPAPELQSEPTSPSSSERALSPPVLDGENSDEDKRPALMQFDIEDPDSNDDQVAAFNAAQVLRIALVISPLFFVSDWIFTASLKMTSVASTSTIGTLSGLFTLLLGALMKVERFSLPKLFAAFATIAGVAIISAFDEGTHEARHLKGDMIAVLSAFIYAVYTIILKTKSGPPGALDISMLFSFMGAAVLIGGIPGFFILHWTSFERFQLPPPRLIGVLFVNALIGTVLSDFMWAKSVVLTTPMIGTLALSLSVPLSLIADIFFRDKHFSVPYFIGVLMVFAGFIIVNLEEIRERRGTSASA